MIIPEHKEKTLNAIVNDLKSIHNIAALVLGGSYSTGMANENSDLDIGIYYHDACPFDIDQIKIIAAKFNIKDSLTVTGFYGWGPWVNGGAWIETKSGEVDFVYRNIEQVIATIEKSNHGVLENDFEQQPPYGFSSVIYLAETFYCLPLYDPAGIIQELKARVSHYPAKLKQAIIQQSLWSAEFTLWQAEKFAAKCDMYNTAGCFTRALKNIIEALLAINELYSIGDKKSIEILKGAASVPEGLEEKINSILCLDQHNLTNKLNELKNLFGQTVLWSDGKYHPYFEL